jgi:hypothetical protein
VWVEEMGASGTGWECIRGDGAIVDFVGEIDLVDQVWI